MSTLMARSLARRMKGRIGLKRNQPALAVHGFGRHHDGFSLSQHGSSVGDVRIAGAQLARFQDEPALQQILGMLRREPAAIFGDANGHDFVLVFIDGVEN